MTYDIDAERARRLEAVGGEYWPVKFGGVIYNLPREIPLELADRLDELQAADGSEGIRDILRILLGDAADTFPFGRLSPQDLAALLDSYMTGIGASLGELQGSPDSSAPTATPSKRTSKPRTKSASRTSTKAS